MHHRLQSCPKCQHLPADQVNSPSLGYYTKLQLDFSHHLDLGHWIELSVSQTFARLIGIPTSETVAIPMPTNQDNFGRSQTSKNRGASNQHKEQMKPTRTSRRTRNCRQYSQLVTRPTSSLAHQPQSQRPTPISSCCRSSPSPTLQPNSMKLSYNQTYEKYVF